MRILKIQSTAFYSTYEVQKGLVVKGKNLILPLSTKLKIAT